MTTSAPIAPSPPDSRGVRRPRLGYLTSMYPAVSHTFVQREVLALRDRGWEVDTFSVRQAPNEQLLSVIDREEADRTHAILPASPAEILGSQVSLLAKDPRGYLGALRSALSTTVAPGRDTGGRRRQLFYLAEAAMLRVEVNRRGISHLHVHFANPAADVAMLACQLPGPPLTWSFTMHGWSEFVDVGRHRLAEKVDDARFVACISHFARSQLMLVGNDRSHWDKLPIVRCGVDPDLFDSPVNPGTGGRLEVLFVGRMTNVKGPDVLLRSAAALRSDGRDVRLTMIGDGPDMEATQAHARDLGLGDGVRFLGAIGQDEIRAHYEDADVFCLPSFAEGIPVVLMEAMAMRRPVISTWIAGIPELIVDDESGLLVAPGSVPSLTAALARLIDDVPLRHRLAEAGRERVLEDFDVRANVAGLAEVFDQQLAAVVE